MRTIALALVVCLTAATLPAAEPLSIGARVRALGADGIEIKGRLTAYGAHDLTITTRKGGHAVTLGFDRLQRLRVADGRDHLGGFALGAVLGIAVAVGAAIATLGGDGGCAEGACAIAAIYYSVLTVPVGAIIGTAAAPIQWRDVRLPAPVDAAPSGLGFRVAPSRGGARFALTYGF